MWLRKSVASCASTVLLIVCSGSVCGQTVSIHRYRFDPDVSQLHIGGGFGGFDLQYAIRGTFGLVIRQPSQEPPTFGFANVRARLVGERPFHGMPLDGWLNMSGWEGTLSNPFTIDFTGMDGQGALMSASGTIGNVVLHLDGANQPPCCDYFDLRLDASAQIVSLTSLSGAEPMHDIATSGGQRHGMLPPWPPPGPKGLLVPEPLGHVTAMVLAWGLMGARSRRQRATSAVREAE